MKKIEPETIKINEIPGGVTAPRKFKAAGVSCGLKKNKQKDLAIVFSEVEASGAGVFTKNAFAAAPVLLTKKQIEEGICRAIVANSGCANAFTGERGTADALAMATTTADCLGIDPEHVAVASTGIIGDYLPMEKVKAGIADACRGISVSGGASAAEAIMTTDTVSKQTAVKFEVNGKLVRLGGMAKGSGMIAPNMATMLAFITTDIDVDGPSMGASLREAVDNTFNMITVDGETSTNDMVVVMANGASGVTLGKNDPEYILFEGALEQACGTLAKMMVRDGEGATKFIELTVKGAHTRQDARQVGMTVANSMLVKTAFFGEDANLGRIIAAAGHAGIDIDPAEVELYFATEKVAENGCYLDYDQGKVEKAMQAEALEITLVIGKGRGSATVWTTDLSHAYVEINARYRT